MLLQKLLSEIQDTWEAWIPRNTTDFTVDSLAYDSRSVERGSFFFAIEGMVTDGHLFLGEALARGAVAVASERKAATEIPVAWIQVNSIRRFMARCANQFYDHPSKKLQLVGVTGTNGKTTVCHLIQSIMNKVSPALRMGTIDTLVGDWKIASRMTTAEAPDIQKILNMGSLQNCRYGVIEVSSHALHLQRVFGCHFPVAVFTNLSQDHLDFHGSLDEYFKAKQLLFQLSHNPGLQFTVTNNDDPYGRRLKELSEVPSFTYGIGEGADVLLHEHRSSQEGLELQLDFFGRTLSIQSPLIGKHNLYNIMAAATASSLLGIGDEAIREGVRTLANVPGRFEKVQIEAPFGVVLDFAHTPDALGNALDLANEVSKGRVICVFGCGGDRDRGKRPLMGKIAVKKADLVIVTSDNPRSENPGDIIQEIQQGIPPEYSNFECIVDREEAILRALKLAEKGDLVLLAGKGHETYQEVQGKRTDFDEREIVKEAFCA